MKIVNFVVPGNEISLIEGENVIVYRIISKTLFTMGLAEIAKYPHYQKENK